MVCPEYMDKLVLGGNKHANLWSTLVTSQTTYRIKC